jgi:hypothetical protein
VDCGIAGSIRAASTAIFSHFNAPSRTGFRRITMQRFRLMNVYFASVVLMLIATIIGMALL